MNKIIKKIKDFLKPKKIKKITFVGQKYFTPKRTVEEEDPILAIKEALFIQCSYILALTFSILSIFEFSLRLYINGIISIFVVFGIIFLLFFFKKGKLFYIIAFTQLMLVWMKVMILIIETNGFYSHMLIWLLLPIFLATIYMDNRFSIILWIFITIASLITIYLLTEFNLLINTKIFVQHYQFVYTIILIIVFITIILLYDNERKLYQQTLTLKNETLEVQKEELHATIEELKLQNERIRQLNERLEDKQKIIENQMIIMKSFSKARAEALEQLKKQKEINDAILSDLQESLKFAQILQKLFLPNSADFKQLFPNSFLIYEQKQYVGGDFYLFKKINQHQKIVIVGDCTGHGPAGGIMSTITLTFIDEIIKNNIYPKQIIEKLRDKIRSIFLHITHRSIFYSVDIAAVLIDTQQKVMYYSGAHLPIIIIRNGNLIEIATKNTMIGELFPISEIHQIKINIQNNDRIYMFTDGYYSQLNPDYEKLSKLKFKKVLLSSANEHIAMQEIVLKQILYDWRKFMELTDDITVIGFQIEI